MNSRNTLTSQTQTNSERRAGNIRLALDAMGNRTSATIASQGGGTFNYGNATSANQYTSITGRSAITHDANGNQLLNGAGAEFTWDSENRLLTVTPVSPSLGDKAQVHSYDALHRRVTRTTREWTSSGWTNLETTYFIYDGWNVIEEWTRTFSPATAATLTRRLTWGQDLAGSPSLQGAGGVGGLLMVEEITSTTTAAYHFHYDGNGNVTEITDHLGASVATYRYDAFGNTLVATGTYAATNRYRFSTKLLDSEVTTAPLYYYGYRYYDPLTGRWPSRDPIEERGGVNLYGFVGNYSYGTFDILGREPVGVGNAGKEVNERGVRITDDATARDKNPGFDVRLEHTHRQKANLSIQLIVITITTKYRGEESSTITQRKQDVWLPSPQMDHFEGIAPDEPVGKELCLFDVAFDSVVGTRSLKDAIGNKECVDLNRDGKITRDECRNNAPILDQKVFDGLVDTLAEPRIKFSIRVVWSKDGNGVITESLTKSQNVQ